MTIEGAIYAMGAFLVLVLMWRTQHVIGKRLSEIQSEVSELRNLVSRLFVMALNPRSAAEPAAVATNIASGEDGPAVKDDAHVPGPDLQGDLAHIDELCAKLITLAPPKEALSLLSKQQAERRASEARERLRPWPLQSNE
jgi:hypothetical protein